MRLSKRYERPGGLGHNLGPVNYEWPVSPLPDFDPDFRIPVVFWLWNATRRCQLSCTYCRIARPDWPEVEWEVAREIINRFRITTENAICVAMGGELTLVEYVKDFVEFATEQRLSYAFLSNAVGISAHRAEELVQLGLNNWSVSVDSGVSGQCPDGPSWRKSDIGFQSLMMMRDLGVADLHAAIVVTRHNARHIVGLIRTLSKEGVWAEPLCVEYSKSEWYDYAPTREELKGIAFEKEDEQMLREVSAEWVELLGTPGILMHATKEYLTDFPDRAVEQDWTGCVPESCPAVDSDGYMRLCQRIGGRESRGIHALEVTTKDGYQRYLAALEADKKEFCRGCFWDCGYTSSGFALKDIEDGKEKFRHERTWG